MSCQPNRYPEWLTDFDKEVAAAQAGEEAAIRADERRRVLDELAQWTQNRYIDGFSLLVKLNELRREGEQ